MSEQTKIRFFTIADYEEEEAWLREQHKAGWKLTRVSIPCFYYFESCTPEDVVYRLDYQNSEEGSDYLQLFQDYGWEHCGRCAGWLYFRKPAAQADSEQEREIFSDDASRVEMIQHIVKTRMLPLLIIFLCCVVPNWIRAMSGGFHGLTAVFGGIFTLLLVVYLYLFLHCGTKLRKLKDKYSQQG